MDTSHVTTTYLEALSPRDFTAASWSISLEPSVTTVTFWVFGSSPSSTVMDLNPGRVPNAELTSRLHPPHVTPVMPATYDTSSAIAIGARARIANVMVAISFFMVLINYGTKKTPHITLVYDSEPLVVTEISAILCQFCVRFAVTPPISGVEHSH